MNDHFWMKQAYELALQAKQKGEVPVGAVLINQEGLLAKAFNQVVQQHDPTAHAEILAIREAALKQQNYRLEQSTLYVTLEPCPMCAGALIHARISRLVFACRDFKAGAAGSAYNLLQGFPLNHQVQIDEGIMQKDCITLLQNFFKSRR